MVRHVRSLVAGLVIAKGCFKVGEGLFDFWVFGFIKDVRMLALYVEAGNVVNVPVILWGVMGEERDSPHVPFKTFDSFCEVVVRPWGLNAVF